MRSIALFGLVLLFATSVLAAPAETFDSWFKDKTMRVDYFHSGGMASENFSLDHVVSDGIWAGSRTRLIDDMNLGKYLFEVVDHASNRLLYSRGFASMYGEWEDTDEPKTSRRTFHESLRFPWPKSTVQIIVKKRDDQSSFHEVWSTTVDPNSRFVNSADIAPLGKVWTLIENGPPSQKVDLVILGDGYTAAEMPKFHSDAKRLVGKLFATEPYKSRMKDFNVRAIDLPTATSGVQRARDGQNRRTALGTEYNIFDSERYLLTYDNKTLRDVASAVPYEYLEILVNDARYGGGGIYNDQATAAVDNAFSEYVFVHEFGHHFAALADEYYTSDVAYQTGAAEHPEPWEPNITALHDPAHVKWADLLDPGIALPTPWDKEAFDKHSYEYQNTRHKMTAEGATPQQMDVLFTQEKEWETKFLASQKYAGKVGAFEGGGYEAKGLYRPSPDCIMFTRDEVGFCAVCRRAIERVIDEYSRP